MTDRIYLMQTDGSLRKARRFTDSQSKWLDLSWPRLTCQPVSRRRA